MHKQTIVMAIATGIHGKNSTCEVVRFVASFPYSEVITKNGYDIGYANHAFVLIIRTDGTMEANPMPMEKSEFEYILQATRKTPTLVWLKRL